MRGNLAGSQSWEPPAYVRQVVAQAAIDGVIGDIPSIAPNATYSLAFPGPALTCDYATPAQQKLFEYYKANSSQKYSTAGYTVWDDYLVRLNFFHLHRNKDCSFPTSTHGSPF
jgi:hypothetical protein